MPQKTSALVDMAAAAAAAVGRPCYPNEQDKKHRRMIANSNERRRMQSINSGFQMLKNLIRPQDGEKLSKASVLQQAVEYIKSLEQDKTYLLAENSRLERLVYNHNQRSGSYHDDEPVVKRRKTDTESSDEGVSMATDETVDLRKQLQDLRQRLESERQLRTLLEQQQLRLVASNYSNRTSNRFINNIETGSRGGVLHSSMSSATTEDFALQGSLEAIVEAIQHLEGKQDSSDSSKTVGKRDSFTNVDDDDDDDHDDSNSAHSTTTMSSDASLQLPASELMRVVAAAEALQFFAERHSAATSKASPSYPCILQPLHSTASNARHHILTHQRLIFHSSS